MIKIFNKTDFKVMPWSNGGGLTTELYSIHSPFVFRLSVANVEQSGPFSIFPNIKRTLILLSGQGFILNEKKLDQKFSPIFFSGEDKINCSLIEGPCRDFNVMINHQWGTCETQIIKRNSNLIIKAQGQQKFIFDYETFTLWSLEKEDSINFEENRTCPLIVMDVNAN
jgi:environmental stress-induced protein Ves